MKRIDPIEVKQAIKDGQLEVRISDNGKRIYLSDVITLPDKSIIYGDTVMIHSSERLENEQKQVRS